MADHDGVAHAGMKREALALAGSPTSTTPKAPRLSKDLLTWLEAL